MTWSSSKTRHHLTDYAEGLTISLLDKLADYYCAGIGNDEFLVCGKTQFTLNSDRRNSNILQRPQYSNCHKVSVDKLRKSASCSCNYRLSTGMPCSHLIKVIGANNLHASMYHPRWYKSTNSHLYTDHSNIRELTDILISHYRENPAIVPLKAVWNRIDLSCDTEEQLWKGTALFEKRCMIGLWHMHVMKIPFDRNELVVLPSSFNVSNLKETDVAPRDEKVKDKDGFESILDVKLNKNVSCASSDEEDMNKNEFLHDAKVDHRVWYNKLQEEIKTISKMCETVPDQKDVVLEGLKKTRRNLEKITAERLETAGRITKNSNATIVSSNLPMETSPTKSRYKRAYEGR